MMVGGLEEELGSTPGRVAPSVPPAGGGVCAAALPISATRGHCRPASHIPEAGPGSGAEGAAAIGSCA